MKEKALELAKRKGYENIQSMLEVGRGLFRAFNAGKHKNTELFIDVNKSDVEEVE